MVQSRGEMPTGLENGEKSSEKEEKPSPLRAVGMLYGDLMSGDAHLGLPAPTPTASHIFIIGLLANMAGGLWGCGRTQS